MADIYKQNVGCDIFGELGGPGPAQTFAIETQHEAVAGVLMMPEDATITTVGFVNGTATNAASITDNTYTISIQGLDASGLPDGTILGGGSPASATFPQSGQAGGVTLGSATSHIITLANSIALQAGTPYAIVIQHTGATDAVNFTTPRYGFTSIGQATRFPYALTKDSTSSTTVWSKATGVGPFGWFLRSASRTYGYPGTSFVAAQTLGGTNEDGFSFTAPSAFGTSNTYALRGIRFQGAANTAAGTWRVNLYANPLVNNNLAIQQSTGAIDSDHSCAATAGFYEVYFADDTLVALTPGSVYGIGISHSAASGFGFLSILVPDASAKTAYPMGGLTFMTRTIAAYPPDGNDDVFTTTATTIVRAELIFGDFTVVNRGRPIYQIGM